MRTNLFNNIDEYTIDRITKMMRDGTPPWTVNRYIMESFHARFGEAVELRRMIEKKIADENKKT